MELLDFPLSTPISIESRGMFFEAYRHGAPAVADQVYSNIFGWQELFDYQVSRHGDFLLVFYREGDDCIQFLPPLMLSGTVVEPGWGDRCCALFQSVNDHLRKNGRREAAFRAFPDHYVRHLPQERITAIAERDTFDYIYRKDDLITLAGQIYAPKRNLIKQFKRKYAYHYESLNKSNLPCVARFIQRWRPVAGRDFGDVASGEYRMVSRLIEHFDELQLCGGILFVDGKEVAVTIATVVPDFAYTDGVHATAVVHSEHALVEYKGSFQIINQLFCASLPPAVVFINREEDLGLPGLRKAKLSYRPERLLAKSRIVLRT